MSNRFHMGVIGLVVLIWGCSKPHDADTTPDGTADIGNAETDASDAHQSELPGMDTGSPPNVLKPVPSQPVGNPVHIATEPLAFVDVTLSAGLSDLGAQTVAFVDYDEDGWPDITATTYDGLKIYRNMGGHFVDGTSQIIQGDSTRLTWVTGLAYADVDGDGDLDLYAGQMGDRDVVLLNDGQGHLQISEVSGLPDGTSTYGVTFFDLNADGKMDLYTSIGLAKIGERSDRPYGLQGAPNHLLLNAGAGFEDVTEAWNAAAGDQSETYGALFVDFDRDGDVDAFVVRDFRPEHYLTQQEGGFVDTSEDAVGDDPTSGMGLSVGDFDGDGHLDVYVTNNEADLLFKGAGDGTFENVFESAIQGGDPTLGIKGWGCSFVDLDHDGDQDVVTVASYDFQGANRLGGWTVLENTGNGQLRDVTQEAGLGEPVDGWGLAVADYDRDGDLDVVAALAQPPNNYPIGPDPATIATGIRLLRNDSARAAGNRFLHLELRQPTGNIYAVGAIVDIEAGPLKTSRVVTAGSSYQSAHWLTLHFGLGARDRADVVRVAWPNGDKEIAHSVPAGVRRLAPFNGECCFPEQTCGAELPSCPVW